MSEDRIAQLNKLRLLAGVQITAEHGKAKNTEVVNEDDYQTRDDNPEGANERVLNGLRQIIQAINKELQREQDPNLIDLHRKDKDQWARVYHQAKKGDRQQASQVSSRLETGARDYIDDLPKRTRRAIAKYLGWTLFESDESVINEQNKQSFRDKVFKAWFGKSKEQIRQEVREMSDKELLMLYEPNKKSGGAQKVQHDEIEKELERRGKDLDLSHYQKQDSVNEQNEQPVARSKLPKDFFTRRGADALGLKNQKGKEASYHSAMQDRHEELAQQAKSEKIKKFHRDEAAKHKQLAKQSQNKKQNQHSTVQEQNEQTYVVKYFANGEEKTSTLTANNTAEARRKANENLPTDARIRSVEMTTELTNENLNAGKKKNSKVKKKKAKTKHVTESTYYGDGYPSHDDKDSQAVNVVGYEDNESELSTDAPSYSKEEAPAQKDSRGEQSMTDYETEVNVPAFIKQEMEDTIKSFRDEAERLEGYASPTARANRHFYNNAADQFERILMHIEKGTIEGIKMAQICASKLMGPMLHKIPTATWKFIQNGGQNRSLKSYMADVDDSYPITGPRNTLDDNTWS